MATSGSFTGGRGGDSNGPYLRLDWKVVETDIPNNRSKVTLSLYLLSTYSLYFSASKTGSLQGASFTYSSGFSGTGSKLIKSSTIWVNHNSDGSKSISFSGNLNIGITWNSSGVSSLSVSGTAALDSIPRASDFTAATLSNTVLNTSTAVTVNYTVTRKSTAFSHLMTLKSGSTVIKTWTSTATGAQTQSITSAEVNKVINSIPNSASGSLTLTMQTKSGSLSIGSAQTRTIAFTLNAAIKPSISGLTAAISGTGLDKTINKYVQSISKVTASVSSYSPGYGSSTSSVSIIVKKSDGTNVQTISSSSGTTANPVSSSGTYNIVATITDGRKRTSSVSSSITVVGYSPPKITTFTMRRNASTTSTVNESTTTSWSALSGSNPATIVISRIANNGAVTELYRLTNSTTGSLSRTANHVSQSDAMSFTYSILITDKFGRKSESRVSVGTSFVEFTIARGKGIGVGKIHESGSLDVSGAARISAAGQALTILTNPSGQHAYIGFNAKDPAVRSGWIGWGSANTDNFSIVSELGDLYLSAKTGVIQINGEFNTMSTIRPSLLNGWLNYGGSYEPSGYFKDKNGIVHLTGLIKNGAASSTVFTLPVGYRPSGQLMFVSNGNGKFARIDIRPDGSVAVGAGYEGAGWLTLNGICFRAA